VCPRPYRTDEWLILS